MSNSTEPGGITRHHNDPPLDQRIPHEPLVPFHQRISCTVKEAYAASGLGPTTIYALIATGELESVKVGRRRLIRVPSLRRLIEGDKAQIGAAR